LLSWNR